MNRIIALITDFGCADWFSGAMKGAILCVNQEAAIVDITHLIPAGDVRAAAFCLLAAHDSFPQGTVLVAVVDPGVGSGRRAIAARAGGYVFIGPDNGVLSLVLDKYKNPEIRVLENKRLLRKSVSSTFHGRDIFAPVAGHVSKGAPFAKVGPRTKKIVRITLPEPRMSGSRIVGSIVYIDHFGNAITNIPSPPASSKTSRVVIKNRVVPLCSCYADVDKGKPVAVRGSCGFVEISVNQGNAARELKIEVGGRIKIY
jgi:S-adenosyl-L-methionine hydrolase (adenosine-forming)